VKTGGGIRNLRELSNLFGEDLDPRIAHQYRKELDVRFTSIGERGRGKLVILRVPTQIPDAFSQTRVDEGETP